MTALSKRERIQGHGNMQAVSIVYCSKNESFHSFSLVISISFKTDTLGSEVAEAQMQLSGDSRGGFWMKKAAKGWWRCSWGCWMETWMSQCQPERKGWLGTDSWGFLMATHSHLFSTIISEELISRRTVTWSGADHPWWKYKLALVWCKFVPLIPLRILFEPLNHSWPLHNSSPSSLADLSP